MNKKASTKKFSDFDKNMENPFVKNAIEQINSSTVKKRMFSTGSDQRAILQAYDPETGETLGHTTFIRQIEIDDDQFIKVYLRDFKVFYGLSEKAMRIFGYILTLLKPNSDEFIFLINDCMQQTIYKAKGSIYAALAELIEANIIARGKTDVFFYINPMVIFNGSRVTFAKTYIKKREDKVAKKTKNTLVDKNQLNLFEDNVIHIK